MTRRQRIATMFAVIALALTASFCISCERKPLFLHDESHIDLEFPMVEVELEAYWDYEIGMGIHYDWHTEWFYGFDADGELTETNIAYQIPDGYNLYLYRKNETYDTHIPSDSRRTDVDGTTYSGTFTWGWWDILAWSKLPKDVEVASIVVDEDDPMYNITARTNIAQLSQARTRSITRGEIRNQPDQLFAGYYENADVFEPLDQHGFLWNDTLQRWRKQIDMRLEPLTYIYLTQVILHHNQGRVVGTDGTGLLSGMAREVKLMTGVTGTDTVNVEYNTRFKLGCKKDDETVDIIAGRLLTFGLPNINANRVASRAEIEADGRHYLEANLLFNNGADTTLVFDVTDQVQQRYRGGVITVELDMTKIPTPGRRDGFSSFDAVVADYDTITRVIEMVKPRK